MKILLFTDTFYDANGVSRFLQDMAFIAHKRDYKFTIITSSYKNFGNKHLPNVINVTPSLCMKMPFYRDLDLTFPNPKKISKIFHRINPDIVHVSTPAYIGYMGRYLARKYDKILTGIYHTNFPAYLKKNTNSTFVYNATLKLMKHFYNPFSLVFSRSHEYIYHLKNQLGLNPQKLKVLPFGIDLQSFAPSLEHEDILRRYPNIGKADIKALYVGRFTKEKNFPFLIKVWKKFYSFMENKNKKAILICLGEGRYMKQKESLKSQGIYLINKQPKEKLAPFYTLADFFLFPSTTDTLGQVVMESLACKTTVILSHIGGPKNILKNSKKTCGVIKSINEDLWVEAMIDLSYNDKKREDYAKNGYEMMQNHSINTSFDMFINFHENLYLA